MISPTAVGSTSSVVSPADVALAEMAPYRQLRFGRHSVSVVPPSIRDPRIHLSTVIITIITIGIARLGFQVSLAQILVTMLTCGLIETTLVLRRTKMLVWPASALQTATSTVLLFRVIGTANGDYWTWRGWYLFAAVGALGLLTKYRIRFSTGHVFNPSNVALVLAFLVLGSGRVEPLDFWWAPLGPWMVAAYAVIFAGGLFICTRLRLIGMGLAFWCSLAAGIGVLAALHHSITVRWSLMPITGLHFWWIILTSPEIFIFLYFMITDPRTVPSGRVARVVFGASVGVLASLLIAPWQTEFGAKVGLLSSLTILCACRPLLECRLPAVGSPEDDPRAFFGRVLLGRGRERATEPIGRRVGLAALAVVALAGALVLANVPSRGGVADAAVDISPDTVADVDPASLPVVSIDRAVAGLSARLATPAGAQDLAASLAWNLEVEAEAVRTGDASLLPAVDDGARLHQLQAIIKAASTSGPRVVTAYTFASLHLEVVFPGGLQRGANAGLISTGTIDDVSYSTAGQETARAKRPFAVTFSLRQTTAGRWLVTDTPLAPG